VNWLNLHISVLDSPQVLRCDPVRRATWLFLLRYCISQENGGTIEDCAAWGDTSWQQIVRVKLREVRAESPLWTWEGNNLRVTFYPSEKESEVQAKRTGGTYGGKAATEAKAQAARENGKRGGRPRTKAETQASETQEPKLNPTEGNGMEGEGNGSTPAAAAAVVAPGCDISDGPETQPAATMTRSWMDWKLTIGRNRVFIDREGNAEGHWAELYSRAGWDEFTKAWEYCASKTAKPGGKVFLSNMMEVIS
jgi:hypothetical protein